MGQQNKWIVKYNSIKTLSALKRIGTTLYEPSIPTMRYIIIETGYTQEQVMQIDGVTGCDESPTGSLGFN